MNPDSNRFERLRDDVDYRSDLQRMIDRKEDHLLEHVLGENGSLDARIGLLRPNGEPVPQHWTQFQIGEVVVIKDYSFKVAYIGETSILFEPVGPVIIGGSATGDAK